MGTRSQGIQAHAGLAATAAATYLQTSIRYVFKLIHAVLLMLRSNSC